MQAAFILLYALGFSVYAYRDWFPALAALLLLTAVLEHPAMPRGMFGIQGLNPWNILLANVVLAWLRQRRRDGIVWDLPRSFSVILGLYVSVVVISFTRMIVDRGGLEQLSVVPLVSEYLINPIKWLIPALLLFDGCRTRARLAWGLGCTLAIYLILALLVVHSMPFAAGLSGVELVRQSRQLIPSGVGYHAIDMAMILAGAAWAILATAPLLRRPVHRAAAIAAAAIVIYALALTAGRMGYITWVAVGGILLMLRRHTLFLAAPLLGVLALIAVPGAAQRMIQGWSEPLASGQTEIDYDEISSGRWIAWPLVVNKIEQAPLIGYGRLATQRTGITRQMREQHRDRFAHPHNAYLEWLLDNGLIGLILAVPLYALLLGQAGRLFRSRDDPWEAAVGGATLALVAALLIAALGSQTFYPREGTIGMWACIGLCVRCLSNSEKTVARP